MLNFYDFEVFKYDWLVVIINPVGRSETVIANDKDKLQEYYDSHKNEIWIGYNSRNYDQYILKGILAGFNPKEINDHIIIQKNPGHTFSSLLRKISLINFDLMPQPPVGLKTLEAFMGHDIKESDVPFDIPRKLTPAELEETIRYCRHDVEETMEVFMRRQDDFNTMMYFVKHFKYPLSYISKTKAQLAAVMLGGNSKGKQFDDEFNFPILDCIRLEKYKYVAEWYRDPKNHKYRINPNDPKSHKHKFETVVACVPHTFAWGGGHGAIAKYHAKGIFLIIDVTAYYPSQQEKFKFGYRVMDNPENFEFIHRSNIKFKRAGDKKARQPFKIMDNAISGQMKQKTSTLYDPMSNNSICINGQLLLLDLIEHLEAANVCDLVQNNTDGIVIKLHDYADFDKVDDIVYEWEKRTGMRMDIDQFFGEIYQKDVNNYLIVDHETGAVKAKGAYVKELNPLDNDLPIANRAMVEYMVHGTPVEKTIQDCNELIQFQKVVKLSEEYDYVTHNGRKYLYKCYRVFASRSKSDGKIFKCRAGSNPAKFGNTPDHCFINNDNIVGATVPENLDKQYYIDLAKTRLQQFGVNLE